MEVLIASKLLIKTTYHEIEINLKTSKNIMHKHIKAPNLDFYDDNLGYSFDLGYVHK